MPSMDDLFKEQFSLIEEMLMQGKVKEAYSVCQQVLNVDPANDKAKKYLREVEKLAQKHNEEFIDKELENLKKMRSEGKFAKVVLRLEEMLKLMPENSRLMDLLVTVQKEYRKSQEVKDEEKALSYEKQAEELLENNKLDEAVEFCSNLMVSSANDKKIADFCRKIRRKIIDAKLKSRKDLMDGDKYEDALNFLYGLRGIEPNYEKLSELIEDFNSKIYAKQMEEKRDFILKAIQDIEFLYQMGKYEECAVTAKELLRTDPKNKFAQNIIPKAEKLSVKKVKKELLKQMDSKENFTDATSNPDEYISI